MGIRRALESILWRLYRRLFTTYDVDGLEFIDIRVDGDDTAELRQLVSEALEYIDDGGSEFGELVRSEIAFVAATREPRERMSRYVNAYFSPFTGYERHNAFYLACTLVGVAHYLREMHREQTAGREPDRAVLRKDAIEEEARFASQFPNSEEWVSYLKGGA